MEKNLKFDFYGVLVEVITDWSEVAARLEKDFSFFVRKSSMTEEKASISITVNQNDSIQSYLEDKKLFSYQNKVQFFTKDHQRYCLYPSGVCSSINFNNNEVVIESKHLHPTHEIAYLVILSRVGKLLDLKGMHRLHGACFSYEGKLCLLSFPSGTGKSTLLSYILCKEGVSLYSDDSPLIDRKGKVYPFPLRLGFEPSAKLPENLSKAESYSLIRHHYGEKQLIDIADLSLSIGKEYFSAYFMLGHRTNKFSVSSASLVNIYSQILKEGVIGFGLPILFEYFWEPGFKDFLIKGKIVLSRCLAFFSFLKKAKKIQLTLKNHDSASNSKLDENAQFLFEYLEEN